MADDYVYPATVHDELAESLEDKKLWRRASTRWRELADAAETDNQREWLIRRCNACLNAANGVADGRKIQAI